MVVDARPPERSQQHLDLILRAADAGPRPFYRAALGSLAVTGALMIVIAWRIRAHDSHPAPQQQMTTAGLVALCLAVVLCASSLAAPGRVRFTWLDRVIAPQERAAIWLALAAWFPLLLIVGYYRAKATFPPSVHWINFGYDDKRWEIAAYLIGVLAPMLWLVMAARLLRTTRDRPANWRSWLRGLVTTRRDAIASAPTGRRPALHERAGATGWRSRLGRWARLAAGVASAVVLAWYFLGPPYYLSHTNAAIGYQEDVFLAGFQAIAKGHLPYIGAAGVQYGPGTQLASYWFMRHVASFSVVGFREAWALFQWTGASILFIVFFIAFGYARGLAASLLSALVYPTLHQVAFEPGSAFGGFWAWANPLRYVGAIALIVLLPAVIKRCPAWRGVAGGFALGILWGVTSYMAQENLAAGAVGALAVGVLLLFTGTFRARAVCTALAAVLVGFLIICLPVLAFYAASGDLGQFLHLYFLAPRAIAAGYSDTGWQGASHKPSPLTTMFYALPFLLAVLGLLVTFEFRPVRIAARWSHDRILLAAVLLTTILLYQGALLRSDTSHFTGTLLAVPGLVVVAATVLPRLLGGRRPAMLIGAGLVLALASFALLPYADFSWSALRSVAEAPYLDRQQLAAAPSPETPGTLAGQRVGTGLANAPRCCQQSSESMASFIDLMNQLHAIIGNRTTYVADFPAGYPGIVYFAADLTPAPVLFDKYTTVLNEPQLREYMAYFRTHVMPRTQALTTASLTAPEARFFARKYSNLQRITLHFRHKPYYVLLRNG